MAPKLGGVPLARMFRQSFCVPPLHLDVQVPRSTGRARAAISVTAPALLYLPTSLSVAWRSDVLTCMARIVPTILALSVAWWSKSWLYTFELPAISFLADISSCFRSGASIPANGFCVPYSPKTGLDKQPRGNFYALLLPHTQTRRLQPRAKIYCN